MTRKITALALGAALALGISGAASAGMYGDDLAKCLVKKTSDKDKTDLMVWAFAAMSAHPAVKTFVVATDAQRDAQTKKAAELMQRLMTVDCRDETVAAVKYEGSGAIEHAFEVLGGVAVTGLISDPAVTANMEKLSQYIDPAKFEELAKAAGARGAALSKKP